jgi:hypothetical protein
MAAELPGRDSAKVVPWYGRHAGVPREPLFDPLVGQDALKLARRHDLIPGEEEQADSSPRASLCEPPV